MSIKKKLATGVAVASLALPVVAGIPTFADEQTETVARLTERVVSQVSDNQYRTEDGVSIRGSELIKESNGAPVVDDYNLGRLSQKESVRFLRDVMDITDKESLEGEKQLARGEAEGSVITNKTKSKYWELMNNSQAVASRMIATVTAGVQPDWVGAYAFLAPAMPFFNTTTAVFVILAAFMFFMFLAVDIFYFMTPPMHVWVETASGKQGLAAFGASVVSQRARNALQNANKEGKSGNPLWSYFASSWLLMFAYAAMLLYFATNSMLTMVGPMANLFSGIFGFQ